MTHAHVLLPLGLFDALKGFPALNVANFYVMHRRHCRASVPTNTDTATACACESDAGAEYRDDDDDETFANLLVIVSQPKLFMKKIN